MVFITKIIHVFLFGHIPLAYQNGGASAPTGAMASLTAPRKGDIGAVNTEPQMYADFYFRYKCARPMPMYGVPGNMDRF